MHRVVITGVGCVSALGLTAPAHIQATREGVSGLATVTQVDPDRLQSKVAAELKNFDPADHLDRKTLGMVDRVAVLGLVAGAEAIADSGLTFDGELAELTAVILGTGVGGMNTVDDNFYRLYAEGAQRLHPFVIPKLMANAAASQITMAHGIRGPAYSIASACSSSNHAIGEAYLKVRSGHMRAAVTGGCESCITFGTLKGWEALRVMAPDVCRPFSKDRKGMVLGEGAGIVVLERLEDARARGAKIYGEIAGFGTSSDAGDLVQPSADGAARAIRGALRDAGLNPDDIDYVNAHGTGTPANDPTETEALKMALGERARAIGISSTKSMHGHALGAAGALELIATLGTFDGILPPTISFTEADPACDLDYIPNVAREAPVRAALSNSFAFGGLNAVLALRRFAA
ncbi:MAG: beta-ketoacyl-[acyl-carrier-protein] synthase family protein [Alphaproteobacteria bacterium]|nr:beta-ketoacyl-[acyl-carrier-protein] synthase family protein [Alphaproteobacteria bacterium]MCB9930096.1 beta-ketoacyl-[acyl-carrier-protein] synthase family protein [Alphaproteobacteria bacterium]